MLRSLRFRLPALFLLAIALAGLVASLIAIRLFQDYTRDRAVVEVRREAIGLAELFRQRAALPVSAASLERATGDRLFFAPYERGFDPFLGEESDDLTRLSRTAVPRSALEGDRVVMFDLYVPDEDKTFIAAAHPFKLGGHRLGALVVATPRDELRSRWLPLLERLALAFLGGVLVAGGLGWYLSRRITIPVLALSRAADEVAEGRYDVELPGVPGGGEIAQLSDRFEDMAARLRESEARERNFLMSVSHELRTPLTAIRGHVEALREGVVEDPELRAASLDVVAAETARLERLVGDVLDLARLNADRFTVLREEVDMGRLLDRAYAAFEQEARRRSIDYRELVHARPVITTDGDRVFQIISNLLANAFHWTPDGGRIAVELTAFDGRVGVAVEDSGPGVPADERDRIFRPFFSRDGGGTGLGLAIARELAHALGGRVKLDSENGRGSRFVLELPADTPESAPAG